jgi:hypothetical protein
LQTCYRSRTDYKDFFICGWFVKIPWGEVFLNILMSKHSW